MNSKLKVIFSSSNEYEDSLPLIENFEMGTEGEYLMRADSNRRKRTNPLSMLKYYVCSCGWIDHIYKYCSNHKPICCRARQLKARTIYFGLSYSTMEKYPSNIICNQKYNILTFIPLVLYEQFKYFLNLFFLIMACSQFIPDIRVGYLYTYWGPLIFVLFVTLIREAVDDFRRFFRDREVNNQQFKKITNEGLKHVQSKNIKVGDVIIVNKDQRIPADMVLLRTSEKSGSVFIRTDQLDGETDWKLRLAIPSTQKLNSDLDIFEVPSQLYAEKPQKDIHSFVGTFTRSSDRSEEGIGVENTLWTNTVVASGSAIGAVVYVGLETRSALNTSKPSMKVGLLDLEVNTMSKILFVMVIILSLIMMILKGFGGPWYRYMFRFVILFSYIIPLSLRVNLDVGKMVYAWMVQRDKEIPNTTVRNTTISEEMGRIQYLLSDKTGTLTKNEMVFKRLHLGTVAYGNDTMDEVGSHLLTYYSNDCNLNQHPRKVLSSKVSEAVKAIALCHNVTPTFEESSMAKGSESELEQHSKTTYQASSPDEVALVSWTEMVGLTLISRDLNEMILKSPNQKLYAYNILHIFPFTSESKRMGIILKDMNSGEIVFYLKGADVVMQNLVLYNDWMKEECDNMAREGLRTLVVAKKTLTEEQYYDFETRYNQAKLSIQDRPGRISSVVESLERELELLCVTGVEDRLHEGVRVTLELLRNAGIKIWMLTGDKLETATCIAKSSCLVSRLQSIHTFRQIKDRAEAHLELNTFRRKLDSALVIMGDSLEIVLRYYEFEFMELACQCPTVVVCRCSPTQKADIVKLLKLHTGKQTCAIGDGGNDVSMIQAADVGVGIVGKEGRQAALAADFSINQFSYLGRLLLVHGRNSYKRSAALSQFVIHRGLIISSMQAVFSAVFYFASIALFPGFLLVGYATIFTNFPVFSLVWDRDVSADTAITYPELYKELTKGRSLNYRTFFMWVLISIYQGGVIMLLAFLLFEEEFIHIVSISFTALILTELLMVALTVRTWHYIIIIAEFLSLALYVASLFIFKSYFDVEFLLSWDFIWKVLVTTSLSCIPLFVLKYLRYKFAPPSYAKLQ